VTEKRKQNRRGIGERRSDDQPALNLRTRLSVRKRRRRCALPAHSMTLAREQSRDREGASLRETASSHRSLAVTALL